MNTSDGGIATIETLQSDWIFHDDQTVDVAVTGFPQKAFDANIEQSAFPITMFSTGDFFERFDNRKSQIQIGSNVFFPGLFVRHTGEHRNQPILRFGQIAGTPTEPIKPRGSPVMDAILIEARSIGGLSGSPVFVIPGRPNQDLDSPYFLLGMIHGHYGVKDFLDSADALFAADEVKSVNMGISIVIPAKHILSTLAHPTLAAHRDLRLRELAERDERNAPEPD